MTLQADFLNAVDKRNLLKEHMSNSMVLERQLYVTSQIALYDASQLSGVPNGDGLVSIELH